jgi:hypothetical protein
VNREDAPGRDVNKNINKRWLIILLLMLCCAPVLASDLPAQFATPPASSKPWVYWFWNNANVTKAGITADLEAMKRVGIGGVIFMDTKQPFAPPLGHAVFMNAEWRELFRFALAEAKRLGLEVDMTNGPSGTGSSGPWITPELSMQMLVSTNLKIAGPLNFSAPLPRPALPVRQSEGGDNSVKYGDFYRDIAVLAFPDTTGGAVPREAVVNLTAKMDSGGHLNWEVPTGHWIIQRLGYTTTGASTEMACVSGLECDKMSREAMDAQFSGMMSKLIAEAGPVDGQALVATHIDSWEIGSQNWTPKFRQEFLKRRGYDPIPFLPNVLDDGHAPVIGDRPTAGRFRWDFDQTRSELLAENYVGRLAKLAHEHGLRLTLEGYDLPFGDEATYTARADEPMSEFWTEWLDPKTQLKGRQMASVGHIYGRPVIGAEAFTSGEDEKWMGYPATIKSLGDFEFCQGINRFVVHRYEHQPYLDPHRAPGATMGVWGLHYERTQTWWEMSGAWHKYLARCQFMLRAGKFVADLCYLRPESPMQTYFTPAPAVPDGYKYDECSAEALEARMSVKNGRLILPDGMSYRLLVLPAASAMTPALAHKLKQLALAGATILVNSSRPQTSPSLADFPKGDEKVNRLTEEIWGDCDGKKVTEHALGKGRVIWGEPIAAVLAKLATPVDFMTDTKLNWIHRHAKGAEIYFAANPAAASVEANCHFRVRDLAPELWNPKTGQMAPLAACQTDSEGISVPLHFEPNGSMFVVFRPRAGKFDPVVSFTRNGESVFASAKPPESMIEIQRATYGVPGDAGRTRDVRAKLQTMVDGGVTDFQVAELAQGDDPALGVRKTLVVEFTRGGRATKISGQDPDTLHIAPIQAASERAAEVRCNAGGRLSIEARQPGRYELKRANGQVLRAKIASVPAPLEISGPWDVSFPPTWGAPEKVTMPQLASWTDSTNAGVKFFSGTATYTKTFDWDKPRESGKQKMETRIDFGNVQVMAQVKLNGHELGILWKPPFRVDVSTALQPGRNTLELRVVNLWPNRMIGDAALPEASRFTWSSWQPFTKDTPLLKSGLLGPVTLQTALILTLP